jgi:tetratricopeptide (TPR) repeat protein
MRRTSVLDHLFGVVVEFAALILILDLGSVFPLLAVTEKNPAGRSPEVESHVGKGYEFVQKGQFEEAAQEFQRALELNPSLTRIRYQLAVSRFALQQWPESRQEFERLQRAGMNDPAVVYYLGRLDLQEEDLEGAIRRLQKIVADPPFPDASYYLGAAYLKKGNLSDAEKWLKRAVELNPHDFRAPERLGRVYLKAGQRAEAEEQFAASSARRQHYNDAARQGVDCVRELTTRPLEQARETCQALFDSSDPDKLTTLGMIYGEQGYYAESLKPFEKAATLDPDSFETNYNLGLSHFRLKQYAEARPWLVKAVELRPDFFSSNALLGATLFTLKEDEAAYRALDHAYQLNPQDADTAGLLFKVSILLAQDRWFKKQYTECQIFLQKANALKPNDSEVQRWLAALKELPTTEKSSKQP